MLDRANKEEAGGPKALQLARGPMSQNSPSRPIGARTPSGGRGHTLFTGKYKSTHDGSPKTPRPSMLQDISITELLDKDDRPTFILDLSDLSNYQPGDLSVVFSNISLTSRSSLLEKITGMNLQKSPQLTVSTSFTDFKRWAMSFVKDQESQDVALPSHSFAGAKWSCYTLRKRLRVFQGQFGSSRGSIGSNPPSAGLTTGVSGSKGNYLKTPNAYSSEEEPQDYFSKTVKQVANWSSGHAGEIIDHYRKKAGPKLSTARSTLVPDDSFSMPEAVPVSKNEEKNIVENDTFVAEDVAQDVERLAVLPQIVPGFFDWTRIENSLTLPKHLQFVLNVDWASTELGLIESWSFELRMMCNFLMANPHPTAMYWGRNQTIIYNEAYILLAGAKHPNLMGQTFVEGWGEIYEEIKPSFEKALGNCESTMKDDDRLFISRNNGKNREESYFSWALIPLVGSAGSVIGLYNPAFEKTRRIITERRLRTFQEIGDKTASARDVRTFWTAVLEGLEANGEDGPFVLVYAVVDEIDSDSQSSTLSTAGASKQCLLEGSIGVPEGHPSAILSIDLHNGKEYIAEIFRDSLEKEGPLYLSVSDGTLDPAFVEGMAFRGFEGIELQEFEAPCTAAVCCPIQLTGGGQTLGFLVIGVNARTPYDDDYDLYLKQLNRQVATSLASVVLFEEEIARGKRAARLAAQQQKNLSTQLRVTSQQAAQTELKFTSLAELNPSGMFTADTEGKFTFVNQAVYDMLKVSKGDLGSSQWMEALKDDDRKRFSRMWAQLVDRGVEIRTEVRCKAPWVDKQGNKGETWVLVMANVEHHQDGSTGELLGSITDISQQKWAEHLEKQKMEEAVELKRQQERVLDMTSHELRNPLTAILQSADEIHPFLMNIKTRQTPMPDSVYGEIDGLMDANDTAIICCEHMKRIINDILTMSKLDAGKLLVTPVAAQPVVLGKSCVKMFAPEARMKGIEMVFVIDDSFKSLKIDWVSLDPTRLTQGVINLITNAIKFTAQKRHKTVTLTLGASLVRLDNNGAIKYVPLLEEREDPTENTAEWGTGEQLYLQYSVKDAGRGITGKEISKLFARFVQTKADDHVHQGGSGLGLYISRVLSELQGGQIGVSSVPGVGSTFSFFIKVRRRDAPPKSGLEVDPTPTGTAATEPWVDNIMEPDPIHFIVVDDNSFMRKLAVRGLTKFKHTVQIAEHGEECLDFLRKSTSWAENKNGKGTGKGEGKGTEGGNLLVIDIILMDQEMPVMDGVTCTKMIRAFEESGQILGHIPIVGVSGNVRPEQTAELLKAGMDDVVAKPYRFKEILPMLAALKSKYPARSLDTEPTF